MSFPGLVLVILSASLLPSSYLALFLPASLFFSWLLSSYGMRATILAGASSQCLGSWLRVIACGVLSSPSSQTPPSFLFGLLVVGQGFCGVAQPVFTNLPARLATTWYSAKMRPLATTVATLSNPIGNALGSALPAFLLSTAATSTEAASGLTYLCLAQALSATFCVVGVYS